MTDPLVHTSYPARRPKFPRLEGYDYSRPGFYFVTLVSAFRECLFGKIQDGEMILNPLGEIIREEWLRSSQIRREIELPVSVIMPNHFHAIVVIRPTVVNDELTRFLALRESGLEIKEAHCRARLPNVRGQRKPRSLGSCIAGFKAFSTKRINELRGSPSLRVWQPDYFESILRNGHAYRNAENYIVSNPSNWEKDKYNLSNVQTRI